MLHAGEGTSLLVARSKLLPKAKPRRVSSEQDSDNSYGGGDLAAGPICKGTEHDAGHHVAAGERAPAGVEERRHPAKSESANSCRPCVPRCSRPPGAPGGLLREEAAHPES